MSKIMCQGHVEVAVVDGAVQVGIERAHGEIEDARVVREGTSCKSSTSFLMAAGELSCREK